MAGRNVVNTCITFIIQFVMFPALQDMSWKAANQIQATGGQEPAFMSPTRGAPYHNAIQVSTELIILRSYIAGEISWSFILNLNVQDIFNLS